MIINTEEKEIIYLYDYDCCSVDAILVIPKKTELEEVQEIIQAVKKCNPSGYTIEDVIKALKNNKIETYCTNPRKVEY